MLPHGKGGSCLRYICFCTFPTTLAWAKIKIKNKQIKMKTKIIKIKNASTDLFILCPSLCEEALNLQILQTKMVQNWQSMKSQPCKCLQYVLGRPVYQLKLYYLIDMLQRTQISVENAPHHPNIERPHGWCIIKHAWNGDRPKPPGYLWLLSNMLVYFIFSTL